jgi:outer membrane biosynthesis protein TonB
MTKSKFIAAALAGVFLASYAFAYTPAETNAKNANSALKIVPAKTTSIDGLPRTFDRTVVNVVFTVDESGQPKDIRVRGTSDQIVKRAVAQSFTQWRFEGAVREAAVASQRYVLPIEIVPAY